jgi:hypothetical protein
MPVRSFGYLPEQTSLNASSDKSSLKAFFPILAPIFRSQPLCYAVLCYAMQNFSLFFQEC